MNSLILQNINKSFGKKNVLSNINLSFKDGEIYALLGENGAGKTTLASVIYGLVKSDSGTICLKSDGVCDLAGDFVHGLKSDLAGGGVCDLVGGGVCDLAGGGVCIDSTKKAIESGISYVYQVPFVSEENTCLENIFLRHRTRGELDNWQHSDFRNNLRHRTRGELDNWQHSDFRNTKQSRESQHSKLFFNRKKMLLRAQQKATELNIKIDFNKKGKELTASEKFFVSFLSAIIKEPKVLILDEPCASLSSTEKANLFAQLKKLKNRGCIVIFITHDKAEALQNADKIIFLQKGKSPLQDNSAIQKLKDLSEEDLKIEQRSQKTSAGKSLQKTSVGKKILCVKNLCATENALSKIENLSFNVFEGKLTCVKGLPEQGLLLLENILCRMWHGKVDGKVHGKVDGKVHGKVDGKVHGTIDFFAEHTMSKSSECAICENAEHTMSKSSECAICENAEHTMSKSSDNHPKDYLKFLPSDLRKNFVSIIPSNKIQRGSPKSLSVKDLLFTKMPKSKSDLQIIADANVETTLNDKVFSLSGGMLQRLILERELCLNPKLLILSQPFAGLDIESTKLLMQRIQNLLQKGVAILALSIDDKLLEEKSDFLVLLNKERK